jgi:ABC-type bacteriocin/lantibiotic exporter with double-glycine peptidase domain
MYKRSEPSFSMVRQELPMSCGAACGRQLLRDIGVDVSEAIVRDLAGFDPGFDIMLDGLRGALDTLHAAGAYDHGAVFPEQLDSLANVVPFIALLRMPSRHFVIVDEVTPSDLRLRDPAGIPEEPSAGAIGWMERAVFVAQWTRAYNGVVFRRAR